ncbi:DUF5331 domain-containing protein [Cyanothece sp. BG0011]|uniref:DUF5331 domain-containing protein n=1 Tax=Cyanothece sp. BG0011 TaxID=2082950 RepID=UPI000D1E262A|nr:DUF5331 domain-containing protein [Cyanothece sp. BG0011]
MNLSQDVMASLKDKWLDFCETNSYWVEEIKQTNHVIVKTPDEGKRPSGLLILGVISGIEPGITNIVPLLMKLNSNFEAIIKALGLDFDPEIELKKRAEERAKNPQLNSSDTDEIERIRQQLQKGEV